MDIFGIVLMSIILAALTIGLWWALYEMGRLSDEDNTFKKDEDSSEE
jgi:hypothetical protein